LVKNINENFMEAKMIHQSPKPLGWKPLKKAGYEELSYEEYIDMKNKEFNKIRKQL